MKGSPSKGRSMRPSEALTCVVKGLGSMEDTRWPIPGEVMSELEWALRYGVDLTTEQRLAAASIVTAYKHLVLMPARRRTEYAQAIKTESRRRGQRT